MDDNLPSLGVDSFEGMNWVNEFDDEYWSSRNV